MAQERFTVTITYPGDHWNPASRDVVAYSGDSALDALGEVIYAIADGRKVKLVARKPKSES